MDFSKIAYLNKSLDTSSSEDAILSQHRIPYAKSKGVLDPVVFNCKRPTILVRGLQKKYGVKSVLHNFNMHVREGTIYALTGATCSGKTVAIECIMGLRKVNAGEILIFGAKLGTNAGVPGRRISYMPQEICLYEDLTVKEIFQYFGTINGLLVRKISEKTESLGTLLNLTCLDRKIGSLTLSQQRRVSIAVTLLSDSEILIFDEPTLGIDPIRRQNFWNHLKKLTTNARATVLYTTNCIEEARHANRMGIMRRGRLLVEDTPVRLLQKHKFSLLEDVFLKICTKDSNKGTQKKAPTNLLELVTVDKKNKLYHPQGMSEDEDDSEVITYDEWKENVVYDVDSSTSGIGGKRIPNKKRPTRPSQANKLPSYPPSGSVAQKLKALIVKYAITLLRNFGFSTFILLAPALMLLMISYSVGPSQNIPFGLVNFEASNFDYCDDMNDTSGCSEDRLSCRLLRTIPEDMIRLLPYQNEQEAMESVGNGESLGFIAIPESFSESMHTWVMERDNENVSDVYPFKIQMDMTDAQSGQSLKRLFYQTFSRFSEKLMEDCAVESHRNFTPFMDEPIYGKDEGQLTDFIASSISINIIYFIGILYAGISYLREKPNGTLCTRSILAGVLTIEIILAQFIIQFVTLLIQVSSIFVILIFLFQIQYPLESIEWPILWSIVLLLLSGIGGLSLGYLVVTICSSKVFVITVACFSFFINLILGEELWSKNAMPESFQWISFILPCSLPSESLRSILIRQWNVDHSNVWPGFVVMSTYISVCWLLLLIIHNIKLYRK